jgi:alkylmercury lyase
MTTDLQTLADQLAPTFPGRDDAPLALAVLHELACGAPVDARQLARATGRDERDVYAVLARWPNVRTDDAARIVAFGGLSISPTAHRFTLGDGERYTWCAWDTLFLPRLLGREAIVRSSCPITGADIRLVVAPDGVRDQRPDDLWVSFPPPHEASTADITGSFCCHVHFLAGSSAAEQWHAGHDRGLVLTVADAFELGRLATRALDPADAVR